MDSKVFIVRDIQEQVSSGKLKSGVRLPSERKMAADLGVSRTTVQAAFKELEALGVVARRPNCRPWITDGANRGPFGVQQADQIALWMLPEIQDVGGAMILNGIRAAFSGHGYSVLISSPPSHEPEAVHQAELQFLRSAKENPRVAGVVVWDVGYADCYSRYNDLVNFGIPLVFVDRVPAADIPADVVAVNHRKAAKRAINYLIGLGHRSVGMVIGNDRASSVLDRIDGYESALKENGITPKKEWLFHLDTRVHVARQCSEEILNRIVHGSDRPTALFAVNDRIAFQMLEAAERMGISIPQDLSLIGFDWLARWMPSGGNLTTIAQPFEEIGRVVAERILSRVATPTQTPRQILFDADLVLKDSTAPFSATPNNSQ